jgi:putative hydrolase of the HAD superfamily
VGTLPGVDVAAAHARFLALREPLYERILTGEWGVDDYRRGQLSQAVAPWGVLGEDALAAHCTLRDAAIAETVAMEGAHALLELLRARGLRLAVLTNGSHGLLERKLEALGIEEHLDAVVSAVDAGHPKPQPAAYTAVADALGLPASGLAMVGDHPEWDVAAPLRAGYAAGVWLDRGHGHHDPSVLPPAAATVATLAAVPAALGLTA